MINDLLIPTDTAVWPQWYKMSDTHKYITTFNDKRYQVGLKFTAGVDADFYSLIVYELHKLERWRNQTAVIEIPVPNRDDVIEKMEDLMRNFEAHMVLTTL